MAEGVESNKARLGKMLALAEAALPPYVEARLQDHYGKNWRQHAQLPDTIARGGRWDLQAYLRVFGLEWRDVFSQTLGANVRDAANATNAGRNAYAHPPPGGDVEDDVTLRGLSGAAELLAAIKAPNAGQAKALTDAMIAYLAGKKAAQLSAPPKAVPASPSATAPAPRPTLTLQPAPPAPARIEQLGLDLAEGRQVGNLEPWRIVAPPRDDITSGRLTLDHFAADLARTERGEAEPAYGDPDEFFRSTHITGGLRLVLENGAQRLTTGKGPSVIGLQTNFGGGKTHTMLGLLHLVRAKDPSKLPGLKDILGDNASRLAGAKAVAFSGTDKGPDVPLALAGARPIRTIWGFLAYKIADDSGLALIAGAEEAGTNPGAEALEKVLRAPGAPTLILLDEIVAYVRQLRDERYEAALGFFQSLTEAAARVPQALIVGSLPESADEVGGERGQETLARLEKLFGRLQSSWRPAQGAETYAIVRRRLFQELDKKGEQARDKTVEAYRKLYRNHKRDFPSGKDEDSYAELMREAYPVHPLLFDTLANEWGTLDRFQRTRGVLKLVAESARRIWLNRSDEPLIQSASVPLGDPAVSGSMIEPLEGPTWGAILDGEVDSDRALPVQLDIERPGLFGKTRAATRAARAVFIGTAPRADAKGGMNSADVRLACATPDDNLSVFSDALSVLANRAAHLYASAGAYWFGPQPTLRKLAETRAKDIEDADADDAIVQVLRAEERSRGRFPLISTCRETPEDIEEGTAVALIVLDPRYPHDSRAEASLACDKAEQVLKTRSGGKLRQARNVLIFVASEAAALGEARKAAKLMLAWRSIRDDKALDLKQSQLDDATEQASNAEHALATSVHRAWSQVIYPVKRRAHDGEPFDLDRVQIRNTAGKTVGQAAWERVSQDRTVIEKFGRLGLSDRLKEAWPAGADHLPLTTIRDWFVQYVAFERLRDESVLADALGDLIADLDGEYAYAEGLDADGRYKGLVMPGKAAVTVRFDGSSLLVTKAAAERQVADVWPGALPTPARPGEDGGETAPDVGPDAPAPVRALRRFFGTVDLDPMRPIPELERIMQSVVAELMRTDGASVSLRLDVEAAAPNGFAPDDAAVVRDNAKTLKFRVEETRFSED
ncbi:MAG TPA: DUF499 domain-containing protein [Caulobacteraceae bacterium]|nr:DUF499 domain-containing protein [Caulobacteraceae bacterium]